jgi:hypothetical protein
MKTGQTESTITGKHKPLRLKAQDPHDFKVISALLQDALIPTTGIHYDPDAHLFTLLANRFCWEHEPDDNDGTPMHKRTHSGVHISHVSKVMQSGMNQKDLTKIHNLLTVHADKHGEVHLIFSEGMQIKLHVDDLLCHLTDLYEHWWTPQAPNHSLD